MHTAAQIAADYAAARGMYAYARDYADRVVTLAEAEVLADAINAAGSVADAVSAAKYADTRLWLELRAYSAVRWWADEARRAAQHSEAA